MCKRRLLIFLFIFIISLFSTTLVIAETFFIRGDANSDGKVDLSDSIFLNNYLFKGGSPPNCNDAADVNDDGKVDISDGVYLNNYLFLGSGSSPPQPYPDAGFDPTVDTLTCGIEEKGVAISKCGGASIEGNCKKQSGETNEGPGGQYCTYDNYEECCDYSTQSTAIAYGGILNPGQEVDRATDSCKDSQILKEVYLNCPILTTSSDSVDYVEKDCNDFNVPGSWSSYYCEDNEVKRRRTLPDYECGNGACYVGGGGYEEEILSQLGDSDYCAVKKSKCGVGCAFEEYDCDSNLECSTGLVCLGPEGGAADGCCKDGQIWDTTNFECDDCKPTDGPCCDSKGKFRPTSSVCNNNLGVEYSCKDGNCLGDRVYKRVEIRYCSGTSSSCNGGTALATSIETYCDSTQFCSGSTTWGSTKPSCKNAQCIDGECCDTTCGVYAFKGNDWICDPKSDEGCPWGTDLGNDAGKRNGGIVCSGTTNTCGDGPLRWRDWFLKQDCSNKEYCDIADSSSYCKRIECSQKSDCGTDDWLDQRFCKNNDVWDKWISGTCNNPGTKSSSCSFSDTDRLREDCKESCRNGACVETPCTDNDGDGYGAQISAQCSKQGIDCNDNNARINPGVAEICGNGVDENCNGNGDDSCGATCSDNIRNQDETDIDCGGVCVSQGKRCVNTKSCKIGNDCQSNYCNLSTLKCENAPACNNECSTSGAPRCLSSTTKQTCGNYDADTCLEWGGDLTCQYGCSNNQCNAAPPLVDLTVTSILVQWPTTTPAAGQNITMIFTLKNVGTANAIGVFWKLDTGSPDPDPVNTIGLKIDAGKSITVSTRIRYVSAGSYAPKAIVDYQNTIVELNELNNELARSIIVN